jgi:predicted kinase
MGVVDSRDEFERGDTVPPFEFIPPVSNAPLDVPDSRLIILIGLPGSGKSTLARQWVLDLPGRSLISTDAIRAHLFGDETIQGPWPKIWREIERQFQQVVEQIAMGSVQSAIYDATNAVRRHRREIMSLAKAKGFNHLTGVWLDVPLEECLKRNRKRDRQVPEEAIHRMHRCLMGAPPNIQEGFDCLIHYNRFQCVDGWVGGATHTLLNP